MTFSRAQAAFTRVARAVTLTLTYITLLRFDLTLVPIALGTMIAVALVRTRP